MKNSFKSVLYIHRLPITSKSVSLISVTHFCNALSKIGLNVTAAFPFPAGICNQNEILSNVAGAPVEFKILNYKRIFKSDRLAFINGVFGKFKLIKKTDADVIYVRTIIPAIIAVILKRYTIIELHNNKFHQKSSFLNAFFTKLFLQIVRSKYLLKTVVISKNLADYFIRCGVNKKKIVIEHDAIDDFFLNFSKPLWESRKFLGLPSDKKIVVYTGSIAKNRKIERIIQLAEMNTEVLFFVIGGDKSECEAYNLIKDVKKIKNIFFISRIPRIEIIEYLNAADILLMLWSKEISTINYCSPLKMFEYMALGKTILGESFPTICEVLENNYDAVLAEPENYKDLSSKFNYILSNDEVKLYGSRAKNKVKDYYTWVKRAQRIVDSL